jgi:hypothetical protein
MKAKSKMLMREATKITDKIVDVGTEKFKEPEVTNGLLTAMLLTLGAILNEVASEDEVSA